jgi:hypothetical protein
MTLCEYVMEVAADEAISRMKNELANLTGQIADEIIETAEECEPQAIN